MTIQISRTEKNISVQSDYNRVFVELARNLAGKWNETSKAWVFDIRDEADVLEACYLAYGEDGFRQKFCDIKMTLPSGMESEDHTLILFGRRIATAFSTSGPVKWASPVVVKTGAIVCSRRYRDEIVEVEAGTTIILRDLSRPLVDKCIAENAYGDAVIEILPDTRDCVRANLMAERDALLARLTEINQLLGE